MKILGSHLYPHLPVIAIWVSSAIKLVAAVLLFSTRLLVLEPPAQKHVTTAKIIHSYKNVIIQHHVSLYSKCTLMSCTVFSLSCFKFQNVKG